MSSVSPSPSSSITSPTHSTPSSSLPLSSPSLSPTTSSSSSPSPSSLPPPPPFSLALSDRLEHLVTRRQKLFDYYLRTLLGTTHWSNLMKIPPHDIDEMAMRFPKSSLHLYLIGMSLGRMMEISNGVTLIMAILQFIEEFQDFEENETGRTTNIHTFFSLLPTATHRPMASNLTSRMRNSHLITLSQNDFITKSPRVSRIPNVPSLPSFPHYDSLHLPYFRFCVPPIDFSYRLLSISSIDMIQLIYSKFLDESCCSDSHSMGTLFAIYESIGKIDKFIFKYLIQNVTHILNETVKGKLNTKNIFKIRETEMDKMINSEKEEWVEVESEGGSGSASGSKDTNDKNKNQNKNTNKASTSPIIKSSSNSSVPISSLSPSSDNLLAHSSQTNDDESLP